MSSGSKRTWDGSLDYGESRELKKARDWRDVHLSPKSAGRLASRSQRDSFDRRPSESYRSRDSDYRDGGRGSDYGRRRNGKDRSRSRTRRYDSRQDRSGTPKIADTGRQPSQPAQSAIPANGAADNDREEGEISPRPPSQPPEAVSALAPISSPQPAKEEPEMELNIPSSPPLVEETLAARRARRQAILAKYANTAFSPAPASLQEKAIASAVQPPPSSSVLSDHPSVANSVNGETGPTTNASSKNASMSPSPTPGTDFALAKGDEEETSHRQTQEENSQAGRPDLISAADYDPSVDRREDEHKRGLVPVQAEEEEIEEVEEEDLDDMFAFADPDKPKKVRKVKRAKPAAPALITTTLDSAADPEGYYNVILGERLDGGRYQVFSSLGKGMFANVVRARVLQTDPGEASGKEVAIKIVRCQESMYKAGLKEVQMLNRLRQADPDDKKHIVRLERTFEHRGHLCLVFENMSMNLRDVVKRFGKDVGLNIRAVRAYAHQLFLALSLLKRLNVMHADIKPDNILVNEHKTVIKLCDLGSASDASENDITPYLVSRFYRAPEIILGYPYDPALDIWSIGCTLYELYSGKILFPGRSNNQMLLMMMELKGRFNGKMIKKAKFGDVYFDEMGAFESVERDKVMGTDVVRKVHISKATRDLRARLMPSASATKMKEDEAKMLSAFVDLLDKCLALDPAKRITPKEALGHPFIRG